MSEDELYDKLRYLDHTREKRRKMAKVILDEPRLIEPLLAIISAVDDPISCRASWVLERVARQDIAHIYPHLERFTALVQKVRLDSAVRPMAKISELLMQAYFSKTPNPAHQRLTSEQLEKITTACFDWLIGEHKVAAQAYAMHSLLLLGLKFDWIHPELKIILEQNYARGSAAYKARARMTLKKLK